MDHPLDTNKVFPLDPSLYKLVPESLAVFQFNTGIYDEDALKEHILNVQAQAYAVAPYPCIRFFNFTRFQISSMSIYQDVLKLGQERKGALLLDLGCCFGSDARKAAFDGYPAHQIVTSDVKRELWDLGHALFRSTPKTFPATFVAGDVLDPAFLSPFKSGAGPDEEVQLQDIRSLNDLRGRVSVVWATSFFHLFSEKDQRRVARAMASLLSPESGSIIYGLHVGLPNKGFLSKDRSKHSKGTMFCHDADSWKEMWVGHSTAPDDVADGLDGPVFAPDSVKLDARVVPRDDIEEGLWIIEWSVTRV